MPLLRGPSWRIGGTRVRPERSLLVVIDGAKALHKTVVAMLGSHALIQRCREHKQRNVTEALPERLRATVRSAMSQAYATRDPRRARRLLDNLARRLEHQHPGAAASLREGFEETLTVMRLGLPGEPRTGVVVHQPDRESFQPGARDQRAGQTPAKRDHGAALDRSILVVPDWKLTKLKRPLN